MIAMILTGTHDPYLVALSILVASFASYTALDLAGRVGAAHGLARRVWLAAAAITMGGGIWSMHFVAMLAFVMPIPISYDIGLTALSLIVAIVVTGVGFQVISRRVSPVRLVLSGVFMGLGIVAMHYTGMAAMRGHDELRYDHLYVAFSIVIAIGASIAALWLAFRTTQLLHKLGAAIVMGLAISGMHYTAMRAAIFAAHGPVHTSHGHAHLDQTNLALAVAGITFVILVCALIASLFDRQFAVLAEKESLMLRQSEERFRTLYRDTPLPLHSLDPRGCIDQVSDAWLALLGYSRHEVIGRPLTDFMTEDSKTRRADADWATLRQGGGLKDVEYRLVKKSGEVIDVLLSARVIEADGRLVRTLAGLVDVTARNRAEEALRQSQKMEAVGQLTGGVAHDFNNLLTVTIGNLELAARVLTHGRHDKLPRLIETARLSAVRGATLTQRLLAFSRRQPLQPQPVDLGKLVCEMSDLFKRTVGETIRIQTELRDDVWRANVDPHQLETALLNLVINSRDAMPGGGTITIATSNVTLRNEELVSSPDVVPGQYVLVSVRDTGVGMPADVLARAFEPFFTTKEMGQGTGLGLSMVYGFIKQSGGHIEIESRAGKGTTIRIYLPRAIAETVAEPVADVSIALPGGSETVLVVEDNESVREYSSDILRSIGYSVLEAHDYRSAHETLTKHPEIRVLFTDVGLPGATGKQLADEALRSHPDLVVLFTTGYARGILHDDAELLAKPFTPEALASRMRDLLDRHAA
jgi:PAS domain S-box-containing protein